MQKITSSILMVAALLIFSVPSVLAAGSSSGYGQTTDCTPVYGGGEHCPKTGVVVIDKKVANPSTGVFVDNLTSSDPKFRPEQVITFNISLTNSGDEMLKNVVIKDMFPSINGQRVIDFMSGPGQYDEKSNTLTFNVNDIEANTSRDFQVKGRVVHQAALQSDQNVICPDPGNRVEARIDGQSEAQTDEARFCIEKNPQASLEFQNNTPITPSSGPREWTLMVGGLVGVLSTGLYLRKLS